MSGLEMFVPAPQPKTELGRYRILSSTAGVRVSPLALGTMSIGTVWQSFMGSMSKEQSFALLDAYADAGGNFIDTANNYQDEETEKIIGEWMEQRQNRDLMFVATKFSTNFRAWELGKGKVVNFSGNHKKSLRLSVEASLKKLRTDYIDLLYVHYWDWTSSIEELVDSLHMLVESGKVLYLGISDTPAWVVSGANYYARAHGKTPFSVYQGKWNVMTRDFERDILPMARYFGMAVCPWDVLGGGKFQTRKAIEERKAKGENLRGGFTGFEQTEGEAKMSEALYKVAQEHGRESVTQVALAYVMQKTRNVFPMIGGRKVEHLHDNIGALTLHLTDEQIQYLESINDFDVGFPMNFCGEDPHETGKPSNLMIGPAQLAIQTRAKPLGRA